MVRVTAIGVDGPDPNLGFRVTAISVWIERNPIYGLYLGLRITAIGAD